MQTVLNKAIHLVAQQIEFVETQILLNCSFVAGKGEDGIYWTGSKVDFVEMCYGIYGTKCVSNGKISLKKLFSAMCRVFNFEVKDYSRIFMDIKNRAAADRIKFPDLMKRSLMQQIEESDQRPPRK